MAIQQFSDVRAYKTFTDNEEVRMGSFKTASDIQLKNTRLGIYIQGMANLVGTEAITQKIYTDVGTTRLLHTSSTMPLSNIVWDGTAQGFLGFFRVDWDRFNLNKEITYYFTAEISGYTRTSDLIVMLNWDFPDSIYDNGGANWQDHPIAQQVFGFAERSV